MIKKIFATSIMMLFAFAVFSQNENARYLGNPDWFIRQISNTTSGSNLSFPTPEGQEIHGRVNLKSDINGTIKISGNTVIDGCSFSFKVESDSEIAGIYISLKERLAFKYYTDKSTSSFMVLDVPIESVICTDYNETNGNSDQADNKSLGTMGSVPLFESYPGATYVIYIDVDGEISTSDWNGGVTINAAAYSWTNQEIQSIWEAVAQDYLIYKVNVTTNRAVFDSTDVNNRMMCIITPTNTASPGAGGVAYINSFGKGNPCWVFNVNAGPHLAASTVSHEVGHTLGLYHDGTSSNAYYGGHNGWSPIMGLGVFNVDQWSIGEYTGANNFENDVAKIGNIFGYKPDDAGNTITTANSLIIESDGKVLNSKNKGLIGSRTDLDVYKFVTTIPGNLSFTISPYYNFSNLNIKVRILDSIGTQLAFADPALTMSATIIAYGMPAGKYFLEIDGTGDGANAIVGYSDYGSLGDYFIDGRIPVSSNQPIAGFESNKIMSCNKTEVKYIDTTLNGPVSWYWTFTGGIPSTSNAANPTVIYSAPGSYNVKLIVQNSYGIDSVLKNEIVKVNFSGITAVTDGIRCDSGTVVLNASGNGGHLDWYDSIAGTIPINSGTTFVPFLTSSKTFYVSETSIPDAQKVGPQDSTFSLGFYYSNTVDNSRGLFFNVYSPCILKSLVVYSKVAGMRTIEIQKGLGGVVLNSKTLNIPAGKNSVTLDFYLTPGDDYYITVTGPLINLFCNLSGTNFPYNLPGLLSITQSLNPNQYYYFYDWEITQPACTSNRVAVKGIINQKPSKPIITRIGDDLNSNQINGNQWYLNGALITGATNQNYHVISNGLYTLITTMNGCRSDTSAPFQVNNVGIDMNGEVFPFELYPNPNNGSFIFKLPEFTVANRIAISNSIGELIYETDIPLNSLELNLDLNNGMYFMVVNINEKIWVHRFIIRK